MALPIDYDTVTVRGKYVYLDGTPARGLIRFTGKIIAISASTKTIIIPATVSATLDENGQFSVLVPATNDPDIQPNGWTYTVSEELSNGGGRSYDIAIPLDAAALGIDLSTVAPVEPAQGSPTATVTLTMYEELSQRVVAVEGVAAGLGNAATRNVGTTAGTVAAGDDARIVGAVQRGTLVVNVKDFGAKGDGSTNDTSAINSALAALTPGATLLFPQGRYMTNGGHVVTQPSVIIKGSSGRAQTYNSQAQLYLRNGANADMLTIAANQVTVRDLSLYGNKTNQTLTSRGLVTPPTAGANYLLLDAVWVDSFNGDGFSFESSGGTLSSTITNCESRVNEGYGMRFYGTATDSMVSNCYIDQNVLSGIFCSAGDLSLTSCHIWGNGTGTTGDRDGITFQSSSGCRVINCYIETQLNGAGIRFKTGANKGHIISGCDIWSNGLQGIYAFSASSCVFSGNVIRTNNYKNGADSSGAGITLDSCTAMLIAGNQFFSVGANRQTYGYYEFGSNNVDIRFTDNMSRAADHTTGGAFFGPGTTASLDVGTTAGTVAAGDDARIVGAVQRSDPRLYASGRRRVGFIGDSITIGVSTYKPPGSTGSVDDSGSPPAWAMLQSERGSWDLIINAGVGGQRSDHMLARITDITNSGCDIGVITTCTWNDIAQGLTVAQSVANVTAMIEALIAANVLPVLCTPTPTGTSDATTARKDGAEQRRREFIKLARQYGIPIVDLFTPIADVTTGTIAAAYLSAANDVHPNEAGRKVMGQALTNVLDRLCLGSTPLGISYAGATDDLLAGIGFFASDTNADGIADGWIHSSGTATPSIYTDPMLGKMQRITTSATARNLARTVTGLVAGHCLEFSGYISKNGTSQAQISLVTAGGNRRVTINNVDPDITRGWFRCEWVLPAGIATSATFFLVAGTGTGTVDFGRLTIRDLTALGLT